MHDCMEPEGWASERPRVLDECSERSRDADKFTQSAQA